MAGELEAFGRRLGMIVDPDAQARIVKAGGMAAKRSALDAARADLGGDLSFSGMRRKVRLGVGFDPHGPSSIELKLRPGGLWRLAESGRRRTKRVKRTKRKGPFVTPYGVRNAFQSTPSRGLNTVTDAVRDARREAPRAADRALEAEIRRVIRG